MKKLLFASVLAAVAFCSVGCAVAQIPPAAGAVASPAPAADTTPAATLAAQAGFDLTKIPLVKIAHTDMLAAAAYAEGNGYSGRGAVWRAIDAQVSACESAVAAAVPKLPAAGSVPGLATLYEVGAEAIGAGIPAAVRINCAAIVLPKL